MEKSTHTFTIPYLINLNDIISETINQHQFEVNSKYNFKQQDEIVKFLMEDKQNVTTTNHYSK